MLEEEYQPRRELPRHLRAPAPEDPGFSFELRPALLSDMPAVREIYNHYVRNSAITFDERASSLASMRSTFQTTVAQRLPFIVAESPSGQILGYAHVLPWSPRAGRRVVEDSIYLGPAAQGRGLGRVLLGALLEQSKKAGVKRVVAVIADRNADASIHLHERLGFVRTGAMGRVGFKFGRWLGTVLMEKKL
ncbi:N-acetyltransferase family protein [Galbitalea sp. SE-J8]|uniref:GNAT family N-acetyltransferase n=1 Tax=Galbitalea sp. SE-J8 TaxID=3054952 RepID=UPI00259D02A6|nr:GNAT family N-acetyltransferase [Galbitalea sp. SE-J8]MDM4764168.1 N-acetyltransferase family protein [Galbitalea sp. SE-J8]